MGTAPFSQTAARTAKTFGRAATRTMGRRLRRVVLPRHAKAKPGATPGVELDQLAAMPAHPEPAAVTAIDYSRDQVQVTHVEELEPFLDARRPEWSAVRWINVDGVHDPRVVEGLAKKYQLHPLAVEDLLHLHQRPKVDAYDGRDGEHPRLYIVSRMIQLIEGHLQSEQVSMFLGQNTVITFQEDPGDVWGPIRERIQRTGSRLRHNDASFLMYALLDAVVDSCFPVLEHFSDHLEELELRVMAGEQTVIHDIHAVKHELMLLRREIWPMREMVNALQRQEHETLSDNTRLYLRDVYDHTVQVIDLAETYREVASGLADMWMSAMSNRMNEVMKVLTIIATIFIPLSFVAGVFGMNFEVMPEMGWEHAYPWSYPIGFWAICIGMSGGMLWWFRRRGWI